MTLKTRPKRYVKYSYLYDESLGKLFSYIVVISIVMEIVIIVLLTNLLIMLLFNTYGDLRELVTARQIFLIFIEVRPNERGGIGSN